MSRIIDIAVLVFAVSSMLSVGLGHTLAQIVGPLRNAANVTRALVANFVVVPLLGLAIIAVVPLEPPHAFGLFLMATAAGAPFLIKLTQAAEGAVALSATLLVLLLPATAVYMPIVVPLALPGAEVSAAAIAGPLVLTMLLPLALGLLARASVPHLAMRVLPPLAPLSSMALVILVAATILVNLAQIMEIFGTIAIVAALLLIAGAFAIGHLLGGRDPEARAVLGLGTGQRNIAAATVVATQVIRHPDTVSMVVVSSLAGYAVLFPLAALIRRRRARNLRPGAA